MRSGCLLSVSPFFSAYSIALNPVRRMRFLPPVRGLLLVRSAALPVAPGGISSDPVLGNGAFSFRARAMILLHERNTAGGTGSNSHQSRLQKVAASFLTCRFLPGKVES